jgi:hypothetical protein
MFPSPLGYRRAPRKLQIVPNICTPFVPIWQSAQRIENTKESVFVLFMFP